MTDNFDGRLQSPYEVKSFLGKGGFGFVVEAMDRKDRKSYAVKCVHLQNNNEHTTPVEVLALRQLQHVNIVGYVDAWKENHPRDQIKQIEKMIKTKHLPREDGSDEGPMVNGKIASGGSSDSINGSASVSWSRSPATQMSLSSPSTNHQDQNESWGNSSSETIYYIILELCSKETLADLLSPANIGRRLDRIEALRIFRELVRGVAYIHEQKIIHRDLKPANIFFSIDGRKTVKIGDFGLVKEETSNICADQKRSFHTGTKLYMSPEQDTPNNRSLITYKVDIYASGIILVELLYPFGSNMERTKVIDNLRRSPVIFPTDMNSMLQIDSLSYQQLIQQLLAHDRHLRPTAADLEKIMENLDKPRSIESVIEVNNEYESPLTASSIQHGQVDACQSRHSVPLHGNDQLDQLPGNWKTSSTVNGLHRCNQAEYFLIFTWPQLISFTVMKARSGHRLTFGVPDVRSIDQMKSIDLRDMPQLKNQIKLIIFTSGRNGDYLVMCICLNEQLWVIDFRRIDVHLILLERLQLPQGSIWCQRLDLSSQENSPVTQWLIINDQNTCYVAQLTSSPTSVDTN